MSVPDRIILEGRIKIPKTVEEQTKIVDMFEDINHFITLHQRESIFAFINKGHNTSVSDTSGNYINVTNPIK
ncbi:hypothetical protein DXB96_08545 [Clostridium sp. OM07-10AC]|nr:hypothetical protein DXC08_09930 [Clostridium sp. OM07-9AC]RHV04230.1 hypothetical protein DXB96_08545 [Clostridium sp. OM07-10AC]